MRIESNAGEEAAFVARFKRALTRDVARPRLREASLSLLREVKIRMPVDTGRARGEWGVPEAGGVWEAAGDGLSIEQGTTLPYVPRLNEGWSRQAPAGFIDAAAENALTLLDELIDGDVIREWSAPGQ